MTWIHSRNQHDNTSAFQTSDWFLDLRQNYFLKLALVFNTYTNLFDTSDRWSSFSMVYSIRV